ncbi:MAG: hypothetical protein AAGG07_07475 [Planctomycetota bacterium]
MPAWIRSILDLGPTNPVAVRLVENGSKRPRHLYIRSLHLAALILVLLWSLLTVGAGDLDYRVLAARGASSFAAVAYLQVALICVLTPVFMAGAIRQEANPRTWDILLTTPLSGPQVVLGHLLGRLVFVYGLLLAGLPLFALTQFFGGVPGTSILAAYLIAAVAALVVGAVAVSLTVSRVAGPRSVFAFYISVVGYLAVTAGADTVLRASGGGSAGGSGTTPLTGLNPFLALRAVLNPEAYPRAELVTGPGTWLAAHPVTAFCAIGIGVSLFLLIFGTLGVRSGGLAASRKGGVPWYRGLLRLGAAGSDRRPARWVDINPISWRESTARNNTLTTLLARLAFLTAGFVWALGLLIAYHTGRLDHDGFRLALLTTVWAEMMVVALVVVNTSATAISREREDGTLDLLLTTPITPSAYLSGKLRGTISSLIPLLSVPIATLAGAGLYSLLGGFGRSGGIEVTTGTALGPVTAPVVLPEAPLVGLLASGPFLAMCVMIGLGWSLRSKGSVGSVVATVGVVAGIAGTVGLCGWRSAAELTLVGPAIGGLSPSSVVFASIDPVDAMLGTLSPQSGTGTSRVSPQDALPTARLSLLIGSAVSALLYAGIVLALRASMVRSFDVTVRKLAGTR